MSHLLTRLADRALGMASTTEPVRTPMFCRDPSGHGEAAERETAGFVHGDIVTSAQRPRHATMEPPVGTSNTVSSQVENEDSPALSFQPVASRVLHELPADREGSPSASSSNDQQQAQDAMTSSALVGVPSRLIETVAADPGPQATTLTPVMSQVSRAVDGHSPANRHGPETPGVATEQPSSSDTLAQTSAASLLRPGDTSARSFPAHPSVIDKLPQERSNAQTLPPTIRVTIGRIEVRAVSTPPAQAPRQRRKSRPSLSLDDYLKQRASDQR